MIKKITEKIRGVFHRLNYEVIVKNDNDSNPISYRNVSHIPEIGEIIGVPVQCDRHSKGVSFLTVREVFYPLKGFPKVIVDRNERKQKHAGRSNYSI